MLTYQYNTECDVPGCGTLSTQGPWPFSQGNEIVGPTLPSDWSLIGDKTYCFRHKVEVITKIDGKEIA